MLCGADRDWTGSCERVMADPAAVGPLTASLSGQFKLQQLCCPSCGALFDSDLVEDVPIN